MFHVKLNIMTLTELKNRIYVTRSSRGRYMYSIFRYNKEYRFFNDDSVLYDIIAYEEPIFGISVKQAYQSIWIQFVSQSKILYSYDR